MPDKNKTEVIKQSLNELLPGLTIDDVKEKYAKGATDSEFALFIDQIRANNLDPRKKEVYFVKYGNQPGQMITGYLVYVARATASGQLNGWDVSVSEATDGRPESATITIYRKDWEQPFTWTVDASEFDKGQATWKTMPNFMLRKVAIAQGFRIAFPQEVGGLPYTTEEVTTFADSNTADEAMRTIDVEPPAPAVPAKKKTTTTKKKDAKVQTETAEQKPQDSKRTGNDQVPDSSTTEEETSGSEKEVTNSETDQKEDTLDETTRNKVFAAFGQFGVKKDKILEIANLADETKMTETHREWLLLRYHDIRLKKTTKEDFEKLKFEG